MLNRLLNKEAKLAVVGLGYVGIPLAAAFAKHMGVIGYDVNEQKLDHYREGMDPTGELDAGALDSKNLSFTSDAAQLEEACFFIVAVPTPVYPDKRPKLDAVIQASRTVGKHMPKGSIVVYESTVYPGVTEEICVPALEEESGMVCGQDFKVGYSPERINPGDKVHRLDTIVKVVSGMDAETLETVAEVYSLVVGAGVFRAAEIKAAEAIKLVENAQRDVNIAFMNEIAMYCNMIGVDTTHVVDGMETKWNALHFKPGLVGGHCIGVDPYYFIYQAEKLGYEPNIIHSSRKLNDSMATYVADMAVRSLIEGRKPVRDAKVYVLGATFKENCGDIRNAKAKEIMMRLNSYGIVPYLSDPAAFQGDVTARYGMDLVPLQQIKDADCLIFTVSHDEYRELTCEQVDSMFLHEEGKQCTLIDVQRMFDKTAVEAKGNLYWGL